MKMRRGASVAGVVLLAGALSGCGAERAVDRAAESVDEAVDVLAALRKTSTKADQAGSAQVETTVSMPGAKGIRMDGLWSWGKGTAFDVQMDARQAGMADVTKSDTVRVLFVDGTYYYKVDPTLVGGPAGKHWLSVDASVVMGRDGTDMAKQSNPVAGLRFIGTSRHAQEVGLETVLGRETTHYTATISKDDLGRAGTVLAPNDKNALMNSFTGGNVTSITIDVWVDGRDLPVRIKQKIGQASVSVTFKSFDKAKQVTAPTAADVLDMTETIKQQAAAGQG
ncbi:hypothetical protein [Streptomyces sp. NPDC056549]|uniref:hypothetical protein n=1 Tax=Streptomyces sp. NPDC056549 TaxID=3345864 RepID=UPI0036BBBE10